MCGKRVSMEPALTGVSGEAAGRPYSAPKRQGYRKHRASRASAQAATRCDLPGPLKCEVPKAYGLWTIKQ